LPVASDRSPVAFRIVPYNCINPPRKSRLLRCGGVGVTIVRKRITTSVRPDAGGRMTA
jgi:hypothetical protein